MLSPLGPEILEVRRTSELPVSAVAVRLGSPSPPLLKLMTTAMLSITSEMASVTTTS